MRLGWRCPQHAFKSKRMKPVISLICIHIADRVLYWGLSVRRLRKKQRYVGLKLSHRRCRWISAMWICYDRACIRMLCGRMACISITFVMCRKNLGEGRAAPLSIFGNISELMANKKSIFHSSKKIISSMVFHFVGGFCVTLLWADRLKLSMKRFIFCFSFRKSGPTPYISPVNQMEYIEPICNQLTVYKCIDLYLVVFVFIAHFNAHTCAMLYFNITWACINNFQQISCIFNFVFLSVMQMAWHVSFWIVATDRIFHGSNEMEKTMAKIDERSIKLKIRMFVERPYSIDHWLCLVVVFVPAHRFGEQFEAWATEMFQNHFIGHCPIFYVLK